ncbi:MAG: hypothetical protein HY963_01210 [Ignavibacteriales bacterium]|nr:hypothetical protein [Ignavibacteriales bacterium]
MIQKSLLDERAETETFLKTCRAKNIVSDTVVRCLVPKPTCNCTLNFGAEIFCTHQLKNEIVKRTLEEK